jgi:cytochrome c556
MALAVAAVGLAVVATTQAHEDMDLPEGPVRDRHELMEGIGRNAKVIGDAMKVGDATKVGGPATEIASAAKKIPSLFPPGSEHPKSRAKPEVWQSPDKFAAQARELEDRATALAKAANERGDVSQAAKDMFAACKSCHEKFRIPED